MVRYESDIPAGASLHNHPSQPCYCREGKGFWHNDHDTCEACGGSLVLGPWQDIGFLRDDLDDYLIVVDDMDAVMELDMDEVEELEPVEV